MEIALKNIGKVKEADVKIDGITVIAGANDTGKSTVGKALYAIFNSLHNIDDKIKEERIESIANLFRSIFINTKHRRFIPSQYFYIQAQKLVEKSTETEMSYDMVSDFLRNMTSDRDRIETLFDDITTQQSLFNIDDLESSAKQVYKILCLPNNEILGFYVDRALKVEFSRQVSNIYSKSSGEISLKIKGNSVNIFIENNIVKTIENPISLMTEATYIDDPYVLDLMEYEAIFPNHFNGLNLYHREDLKSKLSDDRVKNNAVNELLAKKQIDEIYNKINDVCDGEIVKIDNIIGYKKNNSDKVLNFTNLSTGLKSFAIIKQLLEKGFIHANGTLILDEPEVHLHPEWQIAFAELIVLLHKDFGLHILINTHSPYFLNAIETYSQEYGVSNKCNYYSAVADESSSIIKDVTNNTEEIYAKLAQPLQELENIRYRNLDD